MSSLGDKMAKSGFIPLGDNGLAAIGFKPKMNGGPAIKAFTKVWFDIGQRMKDSAGNEVVMSVAAHNQIEYEEYLKKGWKPIIAEARKNEQGTGSGSTAGATDIRPAAEVGQGGAVIPGSGAESKTSRGKGRPKKEK